MQANFPIGEKQKCLNALSGVRGFLTLLYRIPNLNVNFRLNALSGVRGFLTLIRPGRWPRI